MASSYPKIVGLDLSLSATGIASNDGVMTLKVPNKIKVTGGGRRLLWLFRQLNKLVDHDTHVAVVEDYALGGTKYVGHHAVVEWGGVARFWLARRGIPYVLVRPTQLKKYATGKGNAPKTLVVEAALSAGASIAVRRIQDKKNPVTVERFPLADGLEYDDNQADAYWLHQMGVGAYTSIDAVPVQYESLQVLDGIEWPTLYIEGDKHGNV